MKILLVDDHILFREGLCYVLEKLTNNTLFHRFSLKPLVETIMPPA